MVKDKTANAVLLSTPDSRSLHQVLRRVAGRKFSWAFVGSSIPDLREVGEYLQNQGEFLNTTDEFHRVTRDLRDPYLTAVYELGQRFNHLRWWLTSLSSRSSYLSNTYEKLCHLKVGVDLVKARKSGDLLVIVANPALLRALQGNLKEQVTETFGLTAAWQAATIRLLKDPLNMLVHRARFTLRELYRVFQTRLKVRRSYIPTGPVVFIFCWATTGNLANNERFHENYFGDLAARLTKIGHQVVLVPMILRDVGYKETLSQLDNGPFPVMIPSRYIGIKQLIAILNASWLPHPPPTGLHNFGGMDISSLVDEEMRNDWVRDIVPEALLTKAFVNQIARLGISATHMIYLFENQPWERALCLEARRSMSETSLVTFRHSESPPLCLQFHLAPGGEVESPLPDKLVTIGKYGARGLSVGGHHHDRIRIGGALNMQGLLTVDSCGTTRSAGSNVRNARTVLVATSIGPEADELVHISADLFGGNDDINVILKCHPLRPVEMIRGLDRERFSGHLQVSTEPIAQLMQKCSLMVYSVSTVCVQALAQRLPVIYLRPQINLSIDPLEAAPDARLEATGLEDLREKIRWLLDNRDEYITQHEQMWNDLVVDIYGPITDATAKVFVE